MTMASPTFECFQSNLEWKTRIAIGKFTSLGTYQTAVIV